MPCDSHGMSRKLARPNGFEPLTPKFVAMGETIEIIEVRYRKQYIGSRSA